MQITDSVPVASLVANRMSGPIVMQWVPPMDPWVKLNTDGSFLLGMDIVTCCVVVRDHEGRFLVGFCQIGKLLSWSG